VVPIPSLRLAETQHSGLTTTLLLLTYLRRAGAIELSILCKYYQTEIAAVDVQSLRTDVYGQGEGYPEVWPTFAPMCQ
jgi:hypothetical protein